MSFKYCSYCGSPLLKRLIPAETEVMHIYPLIEKRYSRYDRVSGKRQYLPQWYCPKKKWYNRHDQMNGERVITK